MFFKRYYLETLSHASYMVADKLTQTAAIIDPQRDIDLYLEDAKKQGIEIKHVFLTHVHADFIAGHIELREAVGATLYLGHRAKAAFEFEGLVEGAEIVFGQVRLLVLETPGHTPEGISLQVFDQARNKEKPYAVFTGDTLFIGDVGRPDLLASIGYTAEALASELYDSLHLKLMTLSDETRVYPAHGAGSMCGKALSDAAFSTIGEQGRENPALQAASKADFIKEVTRGLGAAPRYFLYDAELNTKERPTLQEAMRRSMKAMDLDAVLAEQEAGCLVVDVRQSPIFAAGHLRGALNIGLDGRFATWVGSLLDADRSFILISEPTRIKEAIVALARIGFHGVKGYLSKAGLDALQTRSDLLSPSLLIKAETLSNRVSELTIIDVRSGNEWASGHIPKSLNIPVDQLPQRFSELSKSDEIVVYCQGGYRSSIAASFLEGAGYDKVLDLEGGYEAWSVL